MFLAPSCLECLQQLEYRDEEERISFLSELFKIVEDEIYSFNPEHIQLLLQWHQSLLDKEEEKYRKPASIYELLSYFKNNVYKKFKPLFLSQVLYYFRFVHPFWVALLFQSNSCYGVNTVKLYKLNKHQQHGLALLLEKAQKYNTPIYVQYGYPLLFGTSHYNDLVEVLEEFFTKQIFLITTRKHRRDKIKREKKINLHRKKKDLVYSSSRDDLTKEWLDLFICHSYPKINAGKKYTEWSNLSDIPFAIIIRNLPNFFISHIRILEEQDRLLMIELAKGKNIRTIAPYHLMTKKMAHQYLHLDFRHGYSRNDYSRDYKYRYATAFLKSLGCRKRLIDIMLGRSSISINYFDENVFDNLQKWKPIVLNFLQWWNEDRELFEVEIYTILAYVNHLFFEGITFNIKGRTLRSLARATREWELRNKLKGQEYTEWDGASYNDWEHKMDQQTYTIRQLTNSDELVEEGAVMHHCVATYIEGCQDEELSIWSLRVNNMDKNKKDNNQVLATIEVQSNSREIVQVKARYNAQPEPYLLSFVERWAMQEGLILNEN